MQTQNVTVDNIMAFLTAMSALSASAQQLVEHVLKKGVLRKLLDEPKAVGSAAEALRGSAVHFCTFAIGAGISLSVGLYPFQMLGLGSAGAVSNALLAGIMTAFGGSLFDEALGAIRAFKKAQEDVRTAMPVAVPRDAYRSPGVPLPR